MQIEIALADVTFTATLNDGRAASDLAERLPLEVEVSDFHGIEKIAHLPENLKIYGEPEGVEPEAGDLCYYSPWGNLAFFYKSYEYSIGLIKIGQLDGDPSVLESIPDDAKATISLVK